MAPLHLINARLPGHTGLQQLQIQQGIITALKPMATSDLPTTSLDLAGDWLSLGGVDLQINGALGLAFPDLNLDNRDKLTEIGQFLWQQGIDAYLPTLVTSSVESIQRALAAIATAMQTPQAQTNTAQIIGVHLEGPFLNPDKRGAHPAEHLLPLTLEQVKRVLGDYGSVVRLITLAPELDPTGTVIPYLCSLGITVSLGHSQASADQAKQAFAQGATMVTHAFNAMPGLHHRQPGLLAAAIVQPQVTCGIIADGQHVVPLMLDLLLRASGDGGLFLVSDALAPLGLPDGNYPWDTRQIEVQQGTARLGDGTLAGTTLPLLTAVQNLVDWGLCSPDRAIALATLAPRQAAGLASNYEGARADLLRWRQTDHGLTWERFVLPDDA